MPKKFASENSKAVVARERRKAVKDAETSRKQQQKEDAYWKDDDKQIKKKQQKKEELEKKREQQLARKAEAKQLLEQEMNTIKATKTVPTQKITRAQISSGITKKVDSEKEKKLTTHLDVPLEENINRIVIEGEEARNVSEAIEILSNKQDNSDKHPEKRVKAAYTAFEEKRIAELKEENPTLRLTQLKQLIFKEWQKSSENPLNKQ